MTDSPSWPDVDDVLALGSPPPDATALRFPERSLCYGELTGLVPGIARRLQGLSCVAVWAESRIETAVAAVACVQSGVPFVPLNPKAGTRELEHLIKDAGPRRIVCSPSTVLPDGLPPRLDITLDPEPVDPVDVGRSSARHAPEDPALVIYTSGTTGPPKGAVLPRRAVATNLDALADAWEWTSSDVVAHALPLFHVHGLVLGILGPLRRGGTVQHFGRFSPEAVSAGLHDDVTMLFGVPTMYGRIADAAEVDADLAAGLRNARLLVSGSAALPPAEHERLERICGQRVVERYGMTETLMITSVRSDGDRRAGYVGGALAGIEIEVLGDDGQPVAADDDTIGEIRVRGPNLFNGYLNRPQATAEALVDGWFVTGDLGTRTSDGYLRIVGRRSTDLIKSGGYKIGAGEIEAALREHPQVLEAAVTAAPDADLGERVVAWIVSRPGSPRPEPRQLSDHVAQLLAPHKRPRTVHFVDELPRNELGKVQKRRLGAS